MKEERCRRNSLSRQLRRWLLSALALAWVLGGCGGAVAQEQSSTPTQMQTSDWVILEQERWTALTNLALTLEGRLTERVTQGTEWQRMLEESRLSIENLENSVVRLQVDLQEMQRSRDRWRESLKQERILWSAERLEITEQRDQAREQRNTAAKTAATLERSNRRNKTAWMVGIPVAAATGVAAGVLYEARN